MSPATLVEDLKAAALYWEMNGGIVKETTLEWKAAAAIEALAAERDAAYDMPHGPTSRVLWSEKYSEILGEYKSELAARKAAEARLAGALNALEQTFNLIKVELHR